MADPQVGQLWPLGDDYPTPVQPGGPGTVVTSPPQDIGEKIGMWTTGCGHFFNNWAIYKVAVGGVPSALVCCPLCGYISRIITPYDLINTDANAIIFG